MSFTEELSALLPADLPNRDACISISARHLDLIVEANQYFNLTRIVSPREAAIKHVLDSILPWRLFAGARHVVDAGTGAGYPAIPLAAVLPEVRFTMLEATQKKARFVESAIASLGLANAEIFPERAEDWLPKNTADIVTARAVAPLHKAAQLFALPASRGARVLLYKGPDAEAEIAEALFEAKKRKVTMTILERYELPDGMGTRTIVEISKVKVGQPFPLPSQQ